MIFVFGSNKAGIHGAGAAKYAFDKLGAEWYVGEGLTGNCYALPTKDEKIEDMELTEIYKHVVKFCEFARRNPDMKFELTPVGTGLAGHSKKDIAGLFLSAKLPSNVYLSSTWIYEEKDET